MSIGSKVKRFRESKGFSQDDLALRLEVAQSTISSIESDKNIPNSLLLSKIAKELEIDINDILEEGKTNINNVEKNEGVINFDSKVETNIGTLNKLSDKLIEQYEERIAELKEQVEYWKNKSEGSK